MEHGGCINVREHKHLHGVAMTPIDNPLKSSSIFMFATDTALTQREWKRDFDMHAWYDCDSSIETRRFAHFFH